MKTLQQTDIRNTLGRLVYKSALPLMRPLIRRTERVYVIIRHKDQVLLVKNWFGRQDWHLPGGGKRRGETVYETAAREAREETGINLPPGSMRDVTEGIWRTDGLGFKYSIVAVEIESKPKLTLKKIEIIGAEWRPPDEEIPAPPEIRKAFKLSYKSAARRRR
jgi:8-oxo-dGTP pyrophosphatase MutT (NUDIX family)